MINRFFVKLYGDAMTIFICNVFYILICIIFVFLAHRAPMYGNVTKEGHFQGSSMTALVLTVSAFLLCGMGIVIPLSIPDALIRSGYLPHPTGYTEQGNFQNLTILSRLAAVFGGLCGFYIGFRATLYLIKVSIFLGVIFAIFEAVCWILTGQGVRFW